MIALSLDKNSLSLLSIDFLQIHVWKVEDNSENTLRPTTGILQCCQVYSFWNVLCRRFWCFDIELTPLPSQSTLFFQNPWQHWAYLWSVSTFKNSHTREEGVVFYRDKNFDFCGENFNSMREAQKHILKNLLPQPSQQTRELIQTKCMTGCWPSSAKRSLSVQAII